MKPPVQLRCSNDLPVRPSSGSLPADIDEDGKPNGGWTPVMMEKPGREDGSVFSEKLLRSNTILYCELWNQTVQFYRDILKLSVNHETGWFVEFHLADETYLSIAHAKKATIRSAEGNGVTLSFRVEDVDRIHELACELRLNPGEIFTVWGARAFHLYDPEGHRIEFWS